MISTGVWIIIILLELAFIVWQIRRLRQNWLHKRHIYMMTQASRDERHEYVWHGEKPKVRK